MRNFRNNNKQGEVCKVRQEKRGDRICTYCSCGRLDFAEEKKIGLGGGGRVVFN